MKPTLFIGSSKEGLEIARAVELQLEEDAEVTIWKDGVFGLGRGTLESLVMTLGQFDFAVLVLTPDDIIISREVISQSPRDNILLELGMFIGRLGRERTFIVYNRDADFKLPSDLAGVSMAEFGERRDKNMVAALGPACTKIRYAIKGLGTVPLQNGYTVRGVSQADILRPTVIARVVTHSEGNIAVTFDLIVHNTGNAPAKNIRLSVDKDELEASFSPSIDDALRDSIERCFSDEGMIPILENGQHATNSFGLISLQKQDTTWKSGAVLNIKISYQDLDGNSYKHDIPLKLGDNSTFAGGAWST